MSFVDFGPGRRAQALETVDTRAQQQGADDIDGQMQQGRDLGRTGTRSTIHRYHSLPQILEPAQDGEVGQKDDAGGHRSTRHAGPPSAAKA